MSDIIPLLSVSSSLKQGGIFTTEKAGAAAKSGRTRGPVSLCDLAKDEKLTQLHLVATNWVDFMSAWKNLKEVGCTLSYGLKLVVCEDMADKSDPSCKTESKVVIWLNGDGAEDYRALISIYTKAATEGFYYYPRIDWKTLKGLWHKDLILSLPFYSSFLAQNTLTFSTITPDLPTKPVMLREVGQELPFDDLLNVSVDRYVAATGAEVQRVKSIYYRRREDAKKWLIWQSVLRRTTWDKPNIDYCCSREFCWTAYKELFTTS